MSFRDGAHLWRFGFFLDKEGEEIFSNKDGFSGDADFSLWFSLANGVVVCVPFSPWVRMGVSIGIPAAHGSTWNPSPASMLHMGPHGILFVLPFFTWIHMGSFSCFPASHGSTWDPSCASLLHMGPMGSFSCFPASHGSTWVPYRASLLHMGPHGSFLCFLASHGSTWDPSRASLLHMVLHGLVLVLPCFTWVPMGSVLCMPASHGSTWAPSRASLLHMGPHGPLLVLPCFTWIQMGSFSFFPASHGFPWASQLNMGSHGFLLVRPCVTWVHMGVLLHPCSTRANRLSSSISAPHGFTWVSSHHPTFTCADGGSSHAFTPTWVHMVLLRGRAEAAAAAQALFGPTEEWGKPPPTDSKLPPLLNGRTPVKPAGRPRSAKKAGKGPESAAPLPQEATLQWVPRGPLGPPGLPTPAERNLRQHLDFPPPPAEQVRGPLPATLLQRQPSAVQGEGQGPTPHPQGQAPAPHAQSQQPPAQWAYHPTLPPGFQSPTLPTGQWLGALAFQQAGLSAAYGHINQLGGPRQARGLPVVLPRPQVLPAPTAASAGNPGPGRSAPAAAPPGSGGADMQPPGQVPYGVGPLPGRPAPGPAPGTSPHMMDVRDLERTFASSQTDLAAIERPSGNIMDFFSKGPQRGPGLVPTSVPARGQNPGLQRLVREGNEWPPLPGHQGSPHSAGHNKLAHMVAGGRSPAGDPVPAPGEQSHAGPSRPHPPPPAVPGGPPGTAPNHAPYVGPPVAPTPSCPEWPHSHAQAQWRVNEGVPEGHRFAPERADPQPGAATENTAPQAGPNGQPAAPGGPPGTAPNHAPYVGPPVRPFPSHPGAAAHSNAPQAPPPQYGQPPQAGPAMHGRDPMPVPQEYIWGGQQHPPGGVHVGPSPQGAMGGAPPLPHVGPGPQGTMPHPLGMLHAGQGFPGPVHHPPNQPEGGGLRGNQSGGHAHPGGPPPGWAWQAAPGAQGPGWAGQNHGSPHGPSAGAYPGWTHQPGPGTQGMYAARPGSQFNAGPPAGFAPLMAPTNHGGHDPNAPPQPGSAAPGFPPGSAPAEQGRYDQAYPLDHGAAPHSGFAVPHPPGPQGPLPGAQSAHWQGARPPPGFEHAVAPGGHDAHHARGAPPHAAPMAAAWGNGASAGLNPPVAAHGGAAVPSRPQGHEAPPHPHRDAPPHAGRAQKREGAEAYAPPHPQGPPPAGGDSLEWPHQAAHKGPRAQFPPHHAHSTPGGSNPRPPAAHQPPPGPHPHPEANGYAEK
eukprot:jgi/Botrbrau1/19131/Bobra.0077s0043.1